MGVPFNAHDSDLGTVMKERDRSLQVYTVYGNEQRQENPLKIVPRPYALHSEVRSWLVYSRGPGLILASGR